MSGANASPEGRSPRVMSRPRSAGSMFWGLILIAAGMVFLLKNLGYDVPIWTGIARYWPILLIVWGCIKLVDYARWKQAGETRPLFGAGEVVLLIVVIMSGTALTAAANMSPDLGHFFELADIDLFDITGNSYHFTEHYEQDVTGPASIEIFNRYGNVEVLPADVDRITVDVDKTVIAQNQDDATQRSKEFMYSIKENGGTYQVISNLNRDNNRVRGRRFKTSLTIKVPKKSAIRIDNRNGNVDLSGLTGDQRVTNSFGRVTLSRVSGAIYISNKNDNVVVEDITGNTEIHNEFANVEVRRVTGTLDLRHRNGGIEIDSVKGDTKVYNAFGGLSIDDIQGNLSISARNTAIEVSRVENDVTVENQFEGVRLDGVKGSISVTNRNGNVDIRFAQPPRKNIQVTNQYSDITLSMPAASTFSIDARTRHSSVSTDFSELIQRDDNNRQSLTGQVGTGGPEIRLDNRNASITIDK
jgi:hypothetical protein